METLVSLGWICFAFFGLIAVVQGVVACVAIIATCRGESKDGKQ